MIASVSMAVTVTVMLVVPATVLHEADIEPPQKGSCKDQCSFQRSLLGSMLVW